ncbi:hypothetical protein GCM10023321_47040 [Pseudonocardia eucalypti]|uniref:Phosphoribosyl-ATP pyrophosphohydrolase n=1 Tax=Pseudonocardia eucalypti TaxID=648755 RepID=A0ABP9QHK8_9PSEU|nr:putative house-cleaning noncanonical NTP pyrophosphatase (MazG superfamily) [Pseudonocardia eucalypti]
MGKLVRDKIPDIIRAGGRTPDLRRLGEAEYVRELHAKLVEEPEELAAAAGPAIVEELADVLEVVRALVRVNGLTMDEVTAHADRKAIARGGFAERWYLNSW